MSAGITLAKSITSTINQSAITTAAFTPAALDLLVVCVLATGNTGGSLSSSAGLTFALLGSATKNSGADTLYIFAAEAPAAASSQTVTFTSSGGNFSGCGMAVLRLAPWYRFGASALRQIASQSNQSAGGTPAPTFAASALTGNPTIGFIGNSTNPATMTEPSGWNELLDDGYPLPATGIEIAVRATTFTGPTATWGSTSASEFASMMRSSTPACSLRATTTIWQGRTVFKNVATKIALFAFDTATGLGKTGDAANITAYVSKDYGTVTVLGDTSATEMDATNAKGWYLFDVAQAETNADALLFTGKSSTSQISVVGQHIFTTPNRFSTLVIDAAGLADANAVKIGPTGAGTAQTARDIGASVLLSTGTGTGQLDFTSGVVKANLAQILGTALTETAGQIAAGFKKFFNIATPAATMDHLVLVDTVTTYTGNTPQTGDSFARLGAPAGASVSADVAAIQADTDNIQTRIPAALVSGRIDASVGAMAADVITAAATAADFTTEVTSGLSTLNAAGVRTAVGLASANLDTQLGAIAGYIDTEVGAIYSRIGAPAGASIAADIAAVKSDSGAILTDTAEIGVAGAGLTALATQVSVDDLPTNAELATALGTADDATLAAIAALTIPTGDEVADALLDRDLSAGSDSGSPTVRTVRQALRFLRNKWSISGTTLTVTKEDDSTASWTAQVSTDAGAVPVIGTDPAGP